MSSIEPDITCGPDLSFHNLTIVPLLGKSETEPKYDTLDAALAAGSLHITETSDAGSVPKIRVRNTGRRPVLIIDGEELVGAKQNRTVNLSILVDAAADVTCRSPAWRPAGGTAARARFASSPRTHFAAGRAAKSAQVSASLMNAGTARADQGQVWEGIAERSSRLRAHSDTRAMADIFERNADPIEAYVRALRSRKHQVGAVFILNGEPTGLDLFDCAPTFKALFPKILRGYALDALALQDEGIPSAGASSERPDIRRARATRLMTDALDAPRHEFRLPGLGATWRLLAP